MQENSKNQTYWTALLYTLPIGTRPAGADFRRNPGCMSDQPFAPQSLSLVLKLLAVRIFTFFRAKNVEFADKSTGFHLVIEQVHCCCSRLTR
jgi:hypothetical protein